MNLHHFSSLTGIEWPFIITLVWKIHSAWCFPYLLSITITNLITSCFVHEGAIIYFFYLQQQWILNYTAYNFFYSYSKPTTLFMVQMRTLDMKDDNCIFHKYSNIKFLNRKPNLHLELFLLLLSCPFTDIPYHFLHKLLCNDVAFKFLFLNSLLLHLRCSLFKVRATPFTLIHQIHNSFISCIGDIQACIHEHLYWDGC